MAYRLQNLTRHPLRLELAGGGVMHVPPGATSPPLREEALYGNPYVADWIRDGTVRRSEARWEDVLEAEYQERGGMPEAPARTVSDIEGIGPAYAERLADEEVRTTNELLERGRTEKGSKELASATGAKPVQVKRWVAMADLLRVPGIDPQAAELLVAGGIESVEDLARAAGGLLARKLAPVAADIRVAGPAPTPAAAAAWVAAARLVHRRPAKPKRGVAP
jgi:predicted flap endonuclease-1-like 5' DNA nuclease